MSLADQSQHWYPTSVQVIVLQARSLRIKGKNGTNDAYAIMQVAKDKFATAVVEKTVSPVWKEEASFDLPLIHHSNAERCTLHVHVMHRALVGPDKLLGQAVINLLELSEIKSRNKTEWFKLLDKAGKPDKDRGEVFVSIQFMRNNMTASMFDLSATDKPRSRLGKLKDKVRGKKKEGLSDSASAIVPAFTQVLTDSEGEGDRDGGADKEEKKKKRKLKSLFSPKSNLQKNMSQSMSVLGPLPERNSSLTGSRSSGLNVDTSEGKKKFKFLTHKRTGSSDSKGSSLHGPSKQGSAAEQSNLCVNGSHVYTEEPQPRSSRAGSTFSLASSGHGSMEDLRRSQGRTSSTTSIDSLRLLKQPSPWPEESSRAEQEEPEEEGRVKSVIEKRVEKLEEEKSRREVEEEEKQMRREEEDAKMREFEEEGRMRRLEEERIRRVEQERIRRDEEERMEEEKRRVEEEQRIKEEQENMRFEEEEKRMIDEEKKRIEEEKISFDEEERIRKGELERRRIIEDEEQNRLEGEKRAEEERNKKLEQGEEERVRLEHQESERLEEERRKILEQERLYEEERMRKEEERLRCDDRMREEDERRMKDEEERVRREDWLREEEKRKKEEEEKRMKDEEERVRREDWLREEEKIKKEEEEERRMRDEEERVRREDWLREEDKRKKEEEEEEEERRMRDEEERVRREEDMLRKVEERKRKEEEEILKREDRLREEEERKRREEDERRMRDDEERVRKEEEEYRHRKGEEERKMKEENRREEERRKEEEDRLRREEEERLRLEEEERKTRQEQRLQREEEDKRRNDERERIMLEEERLQKEAEERITFEEERRKEQEERRRAEEQRRKLMEEQERARLEEEMRKEEKRRHEQDNNLRLAEVEKPIDERDIKRDALVGNDSFKELIPSTNPFEDISSTNPFEETSTASPTGLLTRTTKVSAVKPSSASCAPRPQPLSSNPFLTPSESESSMNPPVGLVDSNASLDLMERKRRAPLPPNNQHLPHNPNTATISLGQAKIAEQALPLSPSATALVGSKDDHHSKEMVCAGGQDHSRALRDKRPAPQPPGSLREKLGAQSAQMTAPLRSSSTDQSHGNQTIDHTDIPSATGGSRVAKHNKGPAPSKPHSSSPHEKMVTKANVDYPTDVEKHSLVEPSVEKQNVSRIDPLTIGTPVEFESNPFTGATSTGLGDRVIDGNQESLQSPFFKNEDVTIPKSLKTSHAPMPPVKMTAISRKEDSGVSKKTQSTGLTLGLAVKRQTHRMDVEHPGSTSTKPPCVFPSLALSSLGPAEPEPNQGSLLQARSQPCEAQLVESGGKGGEPASTSRRPHPVKPLSSLEHKPASNIQGAEVDQSSAVLGGIQDKMKVQGSGVKGPYSQLTQEELISLVVKQQKQLTDKDRKVTELEQYIDNLLVRVIEEAPTILMSLNSLKK